MKSAAVDLYIKTASTMGVRYLMTYINSHGLLRRYELHDTRLVIDGGNLHHKLYHAYQVPSEFGGDYDDYYLICKVS